MRFLVFICSAILSAAAFASVILHPAERVSYELLVYQEIEKVYQEELDRAMVKAPEGKSIYQIRGDAQKQAELLFQKAADVYKIPVYDLPTIRWDLRDNRAGGASFCSEDRPSIMLNEILFVRNYDAMMSQTIAHEVSHIVNCFQNPGLYLEEGYNAHGPEWAKVMSDLGFPPAEFHMFDTTPIALYNMRVEVTILTFLVENQ